MLPIALLVWIKKKNQGYRAGGFRWMGLLRVSGYALVASAIAGTCSFRTARADMAESSISLGRELMPLADLFQENHSILLNGQRIQVSTGSTQDDMKTVLDRFEDHCRTHNASMGDEWKDAFAKVKEKGHGPIPPMPTPGIIRDDRQVEGTVLCMARAPGRSYFEAIHDFGLSWDLASLGKLRYAFVSQDKRGGSFVITAWTEGKFDMHQLLPPAEDNVDAPGSDSDEYPRPPDSQRILTASLAGTPYGLRIYTSNTAPETVANFYDAEMDKRGWAAIAPPNGGEGSRFYIVKNVQLALSASKATDGKTIISFAELGAAPPPGNPPTAPIHLPTH